MILYDFDSNSIIVEATKNRTSKGLTRTYKKMHGRLLSYGLNPKYHKLDNKLPPAMKEYMNMEIKYQLAPPLQHRRNPAERAIRTFKNYFITDLCSTDENVPLQWWCRLLDQAELTVNMLLQSRLNPRFSAYAQLEGFFNFNATLLAPSGTKVVVYETPAARNSWALHGIEGWYVGPAIKQYRCFRYFIPKTGSERIGEIVQFFQQQVRMPSTSSQDVAIKAIHDLTYDIKHPTAATPTLLLGDEKTHALKTLARVFN